MADAAAVDLLEDRAAELILEPRLEATERDARRAGDVPQADAAAKIRTVAQECGFGSSVKLIRVFKQYVGTSPKRFRRESAPPADRGTRASMK